MANIQSRYIVISLCGVRGREGDGGENSEKVDDVDGNGSFSLWDLPPF